MKDNFFNFFRLTWGKLGLAFFFLTTEYFFAFAGIDFSLGEKINQYLFSGLSFIDWNNYFVRSTSLIFLWILLAFLIYAVILFFNNFSGFSIRVKGVSDDKVEKIEKKKLLFSVLMIAGASMITFISAMFLTKVIDSYRLIALDTFFLNLQDNGLVVDFNSVSGLVISFVLTLPVWYLLSDFIVWIYGKGLKERQDEEIMAEHFAIPVDESALTDENS